MTSTSMSMSQSPCSTVTTSVAGSSLIFAQHLQHAELATIPSSTTSGRQRRKSSKGKFSPTLKQTASTPHMNESVDEGGLSPSALDKRKNKLGYQRISIACVHCRRRKIRCVMQDDDAQGRCSNCIRLKKECVFHPVDMSSTSDSRAQSKTATGSKSSSRMSISPSDAGSGLANDHDTEYGRLIALPAPAPHPYEMQVEPGIPLALSRRGALENAEYGFHPGLSSRPDWTSRSFSTPQPAPENPQSAALWPYHEAPLGSDFAAYTQGNLPTTSPYAADPSTYHSYLQQGQPQFMPPPLRSASWTPMDGASPQRFPAIPLPTVASQTPSLQYQFAASSAPSSAISEPNSSGPGVDSMHSFHGHSAQWSYYQPPQDTYMIGRHDSHIEQPWVYHPTHISGGDQQHQNMHHQRRPEDKPPH